jgi:hypothetical protein
MLKGFAGQEETNLFAFNDCSEFRVYSEGVLV